MVQLVRVGRPEKPTRRMVLDLPRWSLGQVTDEDRCWSYKYKEHEYTRSNPIRTEQGSSWHCDFEKDHDGPHDAPRKFKQSPW